jgi:hypothetical protein
MECAVKVDAKGSDRLIGAAEDRRDRDVPSPRFGSQPLMEALGAQDRFDIDLVEQSSIFLELFMCADRECGTNRACRKYCDKRVGTVRHRNHDRVAWADAYATKRVSSHLHPVAQVRIG